MTEKQSMIERPTREQMLSFIERQLATMRPQIADFQARFRASVLGNDAHEQSATLFRDSLLLRLEYTQLCCERENFRTALDISGCVARGLAHRGCGNSAAVRPPGNRLQEAVRARRLSKWR